MTDPRPPWTCGWMAGAFVVVLALLIVSCSGCAAPRPGQGPSATRDSDRVSMSEVAIPDRTGAPIGPPPSHGSTTGPTQRAASRPAPVTVKPSPERSLVTARLTGILAHMGSAPVGPRYAAIPWGPGIRVTICSFRCVTVVSSDTGPSLAMQRAGRVADVSVELFVAICGRPASAGLCQGTVSR